jgi:hypothetical protein
MKQAGFCRKCSTNSGTEIIFDSLDLKNIGLTKNKNIDLKVLFNELIKVKYIEGCYSDFEKALLFHEPDIKIKWTQKFKGNNITYFGIFELFDQVYDINFLEISELNKRKLLSHIEKSFFKGEKDISADNLLDFFNRMLKKAR